MMGIIVNTDEEFDYAKCFDPGEGKQAIDAPGKQRQGDLYTPETAKWQARDCPLCFEPFAVKKIRSQSCKYYTVWYCTNCHRKIV